MHVVPDHLVASIQSCAGVRGCAINLAQSIIPHAGEDGKGQTCN